MARKIVNLLLLVLWISAISGCCAVGRRVDLGKLAQIEKGHTTKQEVFDLIGRPSMIFPYSGPEGGEILSYHYSKVKPSVGTFVPLANIVYDVTEVEQQHVQILIDAEGVVQSITINDEPLQVRTGILAK